MKLSKSKLALAKVINENGGWVGDSVYAANDEGGIICGYKSKPIRNKMASYSWCGSQRNTWIRGIKTPQWHQCALSREEYYQAYPKAGEDGWIEWKGGECPVCGDDDVDVVLVGGSTNHGIADEFDWHRDGGPLSVASYRLHKPEAKPEFCESVMRSIPEPEVKPTIEQLAQDYRNKLDFANRKQQEADDAKASADAALGELERACEALGLLIGITKPATEPELEIADWRDLRVNDVIFVGEYDEHESGEYVVIELEDRDYGNGYAVKTAGIDGNGRWIDTTREWRFIRRT